VLPAAVEWTDAGDDSAAACSAACSCSWPAFNACSEKGYSAGRVAAERVAAERVAADEGGMRQEPACGEPAW